MLYLDTEYCNSVPLTQVHVKFIQFELDARISSHENNLLAGHPIDL